jgi:UDP-N-acetylmuramyl tripeptide synthase
VGEKILDTGDYSGPGGARKLLRHPDTEVAILEVARGGLLRRGLAVNQATTAVITNVAKDHLGEYGIVDLEDMIEAKFIVRQAISQSQDLILNADDIGCVEYAQKLPNKIVWFSLNSETPLIQKHLSTGGTACYVDNSMIVYQNPQFRLEILDVRDIPITFFGAAQHNIQNALAAVAMSFALGLDKNSIQKGLSSFSNTPENNPGRGNYFEKHGVKIIVDFAHNAHGLNRMVETINNIPSKRKLILIGQAGDRSDELINDFIQTALQANPDQIIICEMEKYLRGRKLGEVPALIEKIALESGINKDQIIHAASPLAGTKLALNWAQKEDILLLLALTERQQVLDLLKN